VTLDRGLSPPVWRHIRVLPAGTTSTASAYRHLTPLLLSHTVHANRTALTSREVAMAWQVREAQRRFSELVRRALDEGPQVVPRHGEAAVVVSAREYRRLAGTAPDLAPCLRAAPDLEALALRRGGDRARPPELCGHGELPAGHERRPEARRPGADPHVRAWPASVPGGARSLSGLALGELRQGGGRRRRRDPAHAAVDDTRLAALRRGDADHFVPVTADIAEEWGRPNAPDPCRRSMTRWLRWRGCGG
jgi:prevent-host-death family protein